MLEKEIAAAVRGGKTLIAGEFRFGQATARPWSKNGRSGIIKRATYQVEVNDKPLVLDQTLPDNMDVSLHKFPAKGAKCIFEIAIRQGEKNATYLDVVAVHPLVNV